jgi:hypothetical protein
MLAPEIQEAVLAGSVELHLHELLPVLRRVEWSQQCAAWRAMRWASVVVGVVGALR